MFRFVSSVNLRRRLKFALIRVKFIHHFNVKCTQKTWPIVQKSILIATAIRLLKNVGRWQYHCLCFGQHMINDTAIYFFYMCIDFKKNALCAQSSMMPHSEHRHENQSTSTKHDILWVYRKSNAIWHASENYIIVYIFIMEMNVTQFITLTSLQWNHDGRDGVSNHQPHDCLLKRTFKCRSKKTSKLRVTGLCAGHSPVTGEFPAQMASNTENV